MPCEYCGLDPEEFVALRHDLRQANQINGQKDIEIRRLKKEQAKDRTKDPRFEDAREVLLYWQAQLAPKAREPLSNARLDAVFGRLGRVAKDRLAERFYDVDTLKRCIDGYAAYPYQGEYGKRMPTGRRDQLKIEADYIFDSERRVLAGLRMAEHQEQHTDTFAALSLGERACKVAEYGWLVFPCLPDAKQPAIAHGLLDATRDVERIARYWRKAPDANVAVRTGAESGIVVLDVDGEDGHGSLRTLEQKFDDLPTTLSVVTPRGGQHYYFQHPGTTTIRNSVGIVGPGLDIRGDGGYVLVPPSKVNGRPYEVDEPKVPAPMPAWLLKGLIQYQTRTVGLIEASEWEILFREAITEGRRNDVIAKIAGHYLGRGDSPELTLTQVTALNRTFGRPPLSDREVKRTVLSIARLEARKPLRETG